MSRIEITDATGVTQLAGDAEFPDGLAADGASTPDVATGNSDDLTIKTGDALAGDAGDVLITGGDGDPLSGSGGDVYLTPGDGDTPGKVILFNEAGDEAVTVQSTTLGISSPSLGINVRGVGPAIQINDTGAAVNIGLFGGSPAPKPTITGALSTVIDAPAKAVLTSIIAALAATGYATDGTT